MNRNERGFTLIEVIVALVISVILITAMTDALDVGLHTMDVTEQRITGSNDTQLISDYFNRDVASSEYVSVQGTNFHSAPATDASVNNSLLLSLFTLARGTTNTAPFGMGELWDTPSSGPNAATQVTVETADDIVAQGPVSDRVLQSTDGTFSIDHSVVLSPSSAITRTAVWPNSSAGATTLKLGRTAGTQWPNGELLIAQVGARGGTNTTITTPSGWTLLDSRDAGSTIKSAVYSHSTTILDPAQWTWTFNVSREAAGGIAEYAGAQAVTAHSVDVSPCGGNPPILLMSWTDRGTGGVAHEVTYNLVQDGTSYTLVRKHCINNTGVVVDQQTLARNLIADTGAIATCQPAACGPQSDSRVIVTLTLTEPPPPHQTVGRVYEIRGSTRTTA